MSRLRLPAVLLLVSAAPQLVLCLARAGRRTDLNYVEGWNAYHASAALSEAPLYPPAEALFRNNYPPLSFPLVGALGRLVGDPILAGRWISLLAFGWIALQIALQVRGMTGSRALAVLASLFFAAWTSAAYSGYLGINDPQLLAHALMATGLTCFLRRPTAAGRLAGVTLVTLGGLVKHNLVALPASLLLWLWGRDRRSFWTTLGLGSAFASASAIVLWLVHGPAVFESLVSPRSYSLARAMAGMEIWLAPLQIPLALWTILALSTPRDAYGLLVVGYVAVAAVVGVIFSGGAGVNYNVFLDLPIALALAAGYGLAQVGRAREALALALCIGPLLAAPRALFSLPGQLEMLRRGEAETRADVARLAAVPGPVLCETLALCSWAGKAPEVDLFNARQAFLAGDASEERLLERLRRGEFAVVQLALGGADRDDERVSRVLFETLRQHYVVQSRSVNGLFFRPRPRAADPAGPPRR